MKPLLWLIFQAMLCTMTAGGVGVLLWCSVKHVVPWLDCKVDMFCEQAALPVNVLRSRRFLQLLAADEVKWVCLVLVQWQASNAVCYKHCGIKYNHCCDGAPGHNQNLLLTPSTCEVHGI
jgi:hypothetical protein